MIGLWAEVASLGRRQARSRSSEYEWPSLLSPWGLRNVLQPLEQHLFGKVVLARLVWELRHAQRTCQCWIFVFIIASCKKCVDVRVVLCRRVVNLRQSHVVRWRCKWPGRRLDWSVSSMRFIIIRDGR